MLKSPTIKAMENAVVKAGKGLIRDFGELENLQVSQKAPGDFVTSSDIKAEKIIIEELQKFRPQYGFLVEEGGETKGLDEKFRWVVDPLDGTTNFMHGIPYFCISVALEETKPNGKKDIVASVIFAPIFNEIYWAEKNVGAFCNERKLNVSGRQNIVDSLFAAYPWHGRQSICDNQSLAKSISATTANIRVNGSAALDLAYVAAGKLDGFWHDSLKQWDMAAAILLIREARGIVTCMSGDSSNMLESGTILAGNEFIHEKLSKLVKENV